MSIASKKKIEDFIKKKLEKNFDDDWQTIYQSSDLL